MDCISRTFLLRLTTALTLDGNVGNGLHTSLVHLDNALAMYS